MKKPDMEKVEVDMVPLIDIISLLLMFLIIVGDSAASASSIAMKLPRASEAKTEKEWKVTTEGRIVIQMKKNEAGKYQAVINNKNYETGAETTTSLKDYLDKTLDWAIKKNMAKRNADTTVDWPVKLRIPEDCPMQEVEKVVSTMASLGLVHVHYAAEMDKGK
jgi:biopolymer transport protein ExbD